MSLVPMGGNKLSPNPALVDSYPDVYLSTGLVAENHARESSISREEQDAFALRSHQRAVAAIDAGRFADEIVLVTAKLVAPSEGNGRPAIRELPFARRRRTAARYICRRARQAQAGVSRTRHRHGRQLLADERRRLGSRRDVGRTCARTRPGSSGQVRGVRDGGRRTGAIRPRPVPAIRKVLKLAGLTLDQMDLVELNEAFAAQVLACLKELPIDPDRLNVNGGAIALGHPLGCTGAKLTTTILYEMQRRKARYGLVSMCVGGGMGAAGIFERM